MAGLRRAGGTPAGRRGAAVAIGILLVAVNLRPAVASVGPVLADIGEDLRLSPAALALFTALPIVCFGIAAAAAPRISRRLGVESALLVAMAGLAAGLVVRIGPNEATLFAGTLFAGAGIAVANVLVPALVKRAFPDRAGMMMGAYIGVMAATASIAAAVTVPVASALGGDWRTGLGVWAVPACIATLYWAVHLSRTRAVRAASSSGAESAAASPVRISLLRDHVAWHVTIYMGMQSLVFYAVLAWLPTIYRSHGISAETAGFMLSIMLTVGVPIALLIPSLATWSRHQQWWAASATGLTGIGLAGILLSPTSYPYLWAATLGIGTGTAFPLGLTMIVVRSRDADDAARLSAMSQSVGYLFAAAGPLLVGTLYGATDGWTVPLAVLLVVLTFQLAAGLAAGRARYVGLAPSAITEA